MKERYYNTITDAIHQLEIDHPEFQEENSTGWDMMEALKELQDLYSPEN